jgi:hypothetical protein
MLWSENNSIIGVRMRARNLKCYGKDYCVKLTYSRLQWSGEGEQPFACKFGWAMMIMSWWWWFTVRKRKRRAELLLFLAWVCERRRRTIWEHVESLRARWRECLKEEEEGFQFEGFNLSEIQRVQFESTLNLRVLSLNLRISSWISIWGFKGF